MRHWIRSILFVAMLDVLVGVMAKDVTWFSTALFMSVAALLLALIDEQLSEEDDESSS